MGRPPHSGGPAFRFTHSEVMEMEACLQDVNNLNNSIPPRETILALAEKFSASVDRAGKMIVQPKQVLNWFQNRRYTHKAKVKEPPKSPSITVFTRDDSAQFRNVAPPFPISQGKNLSENVEMEFEAKSARDGAWYDVLTFLSYRMLEPGDPEVRIRFSGFGVEEDEWINVRKCVRQRSLPCEGAECIAVLPGDLILCFQEGKEQALYFDAHILDAQRRRHDVRGCRCRFLVRYDHDQAEEIVSLKKICRRPETDCRLEFFQSTAKAGGVKSNSSKRMRKRRKFIDVNNTVPTETEMAVVEEIMNITLPSISNSNTTAVATSANNNESNGAMASPLSPVHQDTVRAEIEDSLNN